MTWRRRFRIAAPARRWSGALMAALVAGVAVVAAVQEDGFAAHAVDLGTGSVWVSSTGPGQLALLDGASASVTVQLEVAGAGEDLIAVQGAGAGYGVNRSDGSLIRVDAATWDTREIRLLAQSSAGLTAVVGDTALYVTDVQRGLAIKADPKTLASIGEEQSLSSIKGTGAPIVDPAGALWLLEADSGDLIRMVEVPERTELAAGPATQGKLLLVDGSPVVLDFASGSATPIDPTTGKRSGDDVCLDVDPVDTGITATGSATGPELYVVSGRDGVLRVTNLDDGTCNRAISIAPAGSTLGQPLAVADRVFIPNLSTGQVIVVDLSKRTGMTTDSVVAPGATFDLIESDGFVFYNDRASYQAGVIDLDGGIRPIAKYNVDDPGNGVHTNSPEPAQAPAPQAESPTSPASALIPAPPDVIEPTTPPDTPGSVRSHAPTPTSDPPTTPGPSIEPAPRPSRPSPPPVFSLPPPTVGSPAGQPPNTATGTGLQTETSFPTTNSIISSPQPISREITVTVSGSGTVSGAQLPSGCTSTCSFSADDGSSVTLTATPSAGQRFAGWSGTCAEATITCTLTVSAGTSTVGAQFAADTVALDVTVNGQGSINKNGSPFCETGASCHADAPTASAVQLAAIAAEGWQFTGWTGIAECGFDGACSVTMDTPHNLVAVFEQVWSLAVAPPAGGKVTGNGIDCGSTCTLLLPAGAAIVLTVQPDEDKKFAGWQGPCSNSSSTCSFTMDGPKTVQTSFTEYPWGPFEGTWVQFGGGSTGNDRIIATFDSDPLGHIQYQVDCPQPQCDWGRRLIGVGNNRIDAAFIASTEARQLGVTRVGDTLHAEVEITPHDGSATTSWVADFRRQ